MLVDHVLVRVLAFITHIDEWVVAARDLLVVDCVAYFGLICYLKRT